MCGALTYLNFWRVVWISSGSGNRARWIMATQRLYIRRVTPCALINLLGPRSKCSARLKIAWRLGNQRNNALLGRRAMHILMMMFFDLEHRIARAVEKRRPFFSACLFVCCAVGEVGRWGGFVPTRRYRTNTKNRSSGMRETHACAALPARESRVSAVTLLHAATTTPRNATTHNSARAIIVREYTRYSVYFARLLTMWGIYIYMKRVTLIHIRYLGYHDIWVDSVCVCVFWV